MLKRDEDDVGDSHCDNCGETKLMRLFAGFFLCKSCERDAMIHGGFDPDATDEENEAAQ